MFKYVLAALLARSRLSSTFFNRPNDGRFVVQFIEIKAYHYNFFSSFWVLCAKRDVTFNSFPFVFHMLSLGALIRQSHKWELSLLFLSPSYISSPVLYLHSFKSCWFSSWKTFQKQLALAHSHAFSHAFLSSWTPFPINPDTFYFYKFKKQWLSVLGIIYKLKVAGSIPGQGTCLGYGFGT